jgi:maltooligosyltrehalose synthase
VQVPAGRWRNVFTGEELRADGDGAGLAMERVFAHFPVALLERMD